MYIMSFRVLVDVFKTSTSIKGNLNPHDPRKGCMIYKQIELFPQFLGIYAQFMSRAYKVSNWKFGAPKTKSHALAF